MGLIRMAASCDNTGDMLPINLAVCWRLSTWSFPGAGHPGTLCLDTPKSQTLSRKAGVCINHGVYITVWAPGTTHQLGNGGTLPKCRFPEASQGQPHKEAFLRRAVSDHQVNSWLYTFLASGFYIPVRKVFPTQDYERIIPCFSNTLIYF